MFMYRYRFLLNLYLFFIYLVAVRRVHAPVTTRKLPHVLKQTGVCDLRR
jgi:hypothetical protein